MPTLRKGTLGTDITRALEALGVSELVRRWLGSCDCKARQEKLDQLHAWLKRGSLDWRPWA